MLPKQLANLLFVSFSDAKDCTVKVGKNPKGLPMGRWDLTHLMKWDTVCSDRRMGGLGVRHLHLLNKALLCKWICCFASEREAFWRQSLVINMGIWKGVGTLRK